MKKSGSNGATYLSWLDAFWIVQILLVPIGFTSFGRATPLFLASGIVMAVFGTLIVGARRLRRASMSVPLSCLGVTGFVAGYALFLREHPELFMVPIAAMFLWMHYKTDGGREADREEAHPAPIKHEPTEE